jgi:hypothetical protein
VTGIAADPFGSVVTGSCLSAEDFPRHRPQHDLFGFHRYERDLFCQEIALLEGSSIYPTRNFATLGILVTPHIVVSGQVISAWLPMSPWGSDCIFTAGRAGGTSRAVSEDPVAGFLLIVRTDRIVTAHVSTLRRGCDRN